MLSSTSFIGSIREYILLIWQEKHDFNLLAFSEVPDEGDFR